MGAANIARKNWLAIRNTHNGIVRAVASRSIERSQQFIAECQAAAPFSIAPCPLGSYEALLAHPEIDGVYIPLPTGIRKEWVLRAAAAGKHVVCEKPCGINADDLAEMVDACQRHQVQFMDGVMFMHSARLDALRDLIHTRAALGKLRRISTAFSFLAPPEFYTDNIRGDGALEPLGCLGDLGWYCLRFALWAMGWKSPRQVTGRILAEIRRTAASPPVPTEFSGELFFDNGASSEFYCSFNTHLEQWAIVSGTDGSMRLTDFVLPHFGSELSFETFHPFFDVHGCEFNMEPHIHRHTVEEYSNSHSRAQETNLFRNFAAQVQSGKLNASWPAMALQTQQILDACLESARHGSKAVNLV